MKDTLSSWLSSRICPLCAFVSPLIATKMCQLAPSPCLWVLCGIVKTFFDWDESGQSSNGREREEKHREQACDSRGIVGLKFKLGTAVVS